MQALVGVLYQSIFIWLMSCVIIPGLLPLGELDLSFFASVTSDGVFVILWLYTHY